MNTRERAEELHGRMMVRARLIDRARQELHDGFIAEAVNDVLAVLDHVQENEVRLLELHAECHGLIEYCRKVLAQEAMRRPVSIIVEPETDMKSAGPKEGT